MKPATRSFFLRFAFFAIFTVLATIAIVRSARNSDSTQTRISAALPEIQPDRVRSMEFSWNGRHLQIRFENGHWILPDRNGAQAATSQVIELLEAAAKLRPLKELHDLTQDDLRALNLLETPGPNPKQPTCGVILTLRNENGKTLLDLVLGRGHIRPDPERVGAYRIQSFDGRYVRTRGKGKSNDRVFLIPHVLERCHPTMFFWLEQLSIPALESPFYLSVSRITPDGKKSPVWWVVPKPGGYRFIFPTDKRPAISKLTAKLANIVQPFSIDLCTDAKDVKEFRPEGAFNTVLPDGFAYELVFGKTNGRAAGRLKVTFRADKTTQLAGETNEDFAKRRKKLAARAAYEKRVADGRLFLLKPELAAQLFEIPAE